MEARPLGYIEDMLARLEMSNASGVLPQDDRTAVDRINDAMRTLAALWAQIQAREVDPGTKSDLQQTITALSQVVDSVTQLREVRQARFEREIRARLEKLESRPTDDPVMGVF